MGVSGHRDCAESGDAHAPGTPCRQCYRDPAIPSVRITVVPGTAKPVVYPITPGIRGWSQTAKIPLVHGKARGYDAGCA